MARILVSDGHDQVREFIQYALTEAGHEVVAAVRSGGEALEHLGKVVDLLIAGRRCPDEKGDDEVVRRLCADGHPVPVIVAVSFPEALSLQPCPDCRLHVLSKPFTVYHRDAARCRGGDDLSRSSSSDTAPLWEISSSTASRRPLESKRGGRLIASLPV